VNKVLLSKDVRFIICKLNNLIRRAGTLDLTYIKKLTVVFRVISLRRVSDQAFSEVVGGESHSNLEYILEIWKKNHCFTIKCFRHRL
jgi:hypothetical protein